MINFLGIITEPTFTDLLLGDLKGPQWVFLLLLIILGIFLRIFRRISQREDKLDKPSFTVWREDIRNWAKLFYSMILMYALVRFYSEYEPAIKKLIPENLQASIYLIMFGLGFFLHKVSALLDSKLSKK